MPGTFLVGIDENGMGPRLGPMIVTAVLAEAATREAEALVRRRPRGKAGERLDDSKKLVAFGDSGLGEAWARHLGAGSTPSEVLHSLAIDGVDDLRSPCPSGHDQQCWSDTGESFGASEELVRDVGGDLTKLAQKGLTVLGAYVAIVCTRRMNLAAMRGVTRFDLDLHAMERLALAARARAGADLQVTCGKVGGFDSYAMRFRHLGRCRTLGEGRARSEYCVDDLGTIAFVRDADAKHVLVSMASLVGKWARDLLMMRIVRYYREAAPELELPDASGYHEPTTNRFVDATRLVRKARGIEDDCFERKRADKNAAQITLGF